MDLPPHADNKRHINPLHKSLWQATRELVDDTLQPLEQVLERDLAKKVFHLSALVLIVLGGITKIIESLSTSINSDTANAGLFSMESYFHNNPLLIGHISLSYDPYYFPELYPIYHVTQVLSGYSPNVLNLTALAVFFINIVIFAYIVYMTTRSWTSALVFSAIIINLPPLSFINYAQPFWHNGALLIAGICLVLTIWYLDGQKGSCPRWCIGAISLALLYMTFFSDYILGIWVIIPVLLSYLFLQDRRSWHSRLYFMGVLLCIPLMYTAKEVFLPDLVRYKIGFADSAGVVVNHFQGFIQQLFIILSGLQITSQEGLAVLGLVFIVLLCCTGYYLIRNERQTRIPLPHILFFSVLVMFFVYLLMGWVTEGGQRYLIFQGFAIYTLVLILLHKYKVVLPALLILGLIFLGMNIPAVLTPATPNISEYTLIEELERQNLTHGLGDYWTANLVTYLSKEKVTVRAVNFKTTPSGQNEIKLFPYNTFSGWMQESMKIRRPIFVVVKESEHPGLAESIVRGGLAGLRPEPPPSVISNGDYRVILFPAPNATGN